MGGPAIVAYLGSGGDADVELEGLGTNVGRRFYRYAQRVVSRRLDHWHFQLFDEYRDVPVYKAEFKDCFVLIAVEDAGDDGITVTVMLAARFGVQTLANRQWDGRDMKFVRGEILAPRLQDHFR